MPYTLHFTWHSCFAISSSAFVMWLLICTISPRFQVMAPLVVALGRHSLSLCPLFFISRLFYLCFFEVFPRKPSFSWSTYGTTVVLIALRFCRSGVGTCIQRQLYVLPVLICRLAYSVHTAPPVQMNCWICVSLSSTNKTLQFICLHVVSAFRLHVLLIHPS